MLRRLKTRNAVEVASTSRCKRYQFVCGILCNSAGGFRTKSAITKGKLPSRSNRSAALMVSSALWQRTQSRWRKQALPKGLGSKESRPSIRARKYRSRCAAWRRTEINEALPALTCGLMDSIMAPLGRPPPITKSRKGRPVTNRVVGDNGACGKRSANRLRRSTIFPGGMRVRPARPAELSYPTSPAPSQSRVRSPR